jgi:hypothetical protein
MAEFAPSQAAFGLHWLLLKIKLEAENSRRKL